MSTANEKIIYSFQIGSNLDWSDTPKTFKLFTLAEAKEHALNLSLLHKTKIRWCDKFDNGNYTLHPKVLNS